MVARSELVAQGYRDAQGRPPQYAVVGYLSAWAWQLVGPTTGDPQRYWYSQESDTEQAQRLRKAGQVLARIADHFNQRVGGLDEGARALRARVRQLNDIYQGGARVYKAPVNPQVFLAEEVQAGSRLTDPAALADALAGYSGDVAADPDTLGVLQAQAEKIMPDPEPLLAKLETHPPMCTREAIVVDAVERHLAGTLTDAGEITRARNGLSKLGSARPDQRRVAAPVKTLLRKWGRTDSDRCQTIPALFPALPNIPGGGSFWNQDEVDRTARLNLYRATLLAMRALGSVTNDLVTQACRATKDQFPGFASRNRRDLIKGELTRVTAEALAHQLHAGPNLGSFLRYRDNEAGIDDGDLLTAGWLAERLGLDELVVAAVRLVTGTDAAVEPPHTLSHSVLLRQLRLHDDLQDLKSVPVQFQGKAKERLTNWRRVHLEPLADGWLVRVIETSDGSDWFDTPRMRRLFAGRRIIQARRERLLGTATSHYIFRGVGFEELALEYLLRYRWLVKLPANLTESQLQRANNLRGDWAAVVSLDEQAWQAAGAEDTAAAADDAARPVCEVLRIALDETAETGQHLLHDWFAKHYILGCDPVTAAMSRAANMIAKSDGEVTPHTGHFGLDALHGAGGSRLPAAQVVEQDSGLDPFRVGQARTLSDFIDSDMAEQTRAQLDELVREYVQDQHDSVLAELAALLVPVVANALPGDEVEDHAQRVRAVQDEFSHEPLVDLLRDDDPLIRHTLAWADKIVELATLGYWQPGNPETTPPPIGPIAPPP